MSELVIVCDNCGAKYRLPSSFSGDKAKCKQCGSVVDVAAQRSAASAPKAAPAVPAPAARPARSADRPARAGRDGSDRPVRAARGDSDGRSRRGKGDDTADAAASPKRGHGERAEKKNNSMLLVGGGVGALAIVAVIVVLSMGGGKNSEPAKTDTAQTPPATQPAKDVPGGAGSGAPPATDPTAPAVQPAASASEPAKPATAEAAADKQPAATADAPASAKTGAENAADSSAEPKRNWENLKTKSLDEVFDPSTLGEVTWPDDVAEEQRTEIQSLLTDILDGGRAGITAKPKLAKVGYPAIFGIINQLRRIDYKSSGEQMTAWELNKLLQEICAGMNAGFDAVSDGEDLDPRKADWNARTNQAWAKLLVKFPSREAFDTWRKERLAKGLDEKGLDKK